MAQGDRPVGAPDPPPHGRAGAGALKLCLLSSSVEWYLRQVWEPLLFEDEEWAVDRRRRRRDPVTPARASQSAQLKEQTHLTTVGLPVQSFRTLLAHLGTRGRNTCVVTAAPNQTTFRQVTEADALQAEALRMIHRGARNGIGN